MTFGVGSRAGVAAAPFASFGAMAEQRWGNSRRLWGSKTANKSRKQLYEDKEHQNRS